SFRIRRLAFVLGLVATVAASVGGQNGPPVHGVTRIYVEPFAAKPSSDEVRDALVAQLRKLRAISLAPNASAADARLTPSDRKQVFADCFRQRSISERPMIRRSCARSPRTGLPTTCCSRLSPARSYPSSMCGGAARRNHVHAGSADGDLPGPRHEMERPGD